MKTVYLWVHTVVALGACSAFVACSSANDESPGDAGPGTGGSTSAGTGATGSGATGGVAGPDAAASAGGTAGGVAGSAGSGAAGAGGSGGIGTGGGAAGSAATGAAGAGGAGESGAGGGAAGSAGSGAAGAGGAGESGAGGSTGGVGGVAGDGGDSGSPAAWRPFSDDSPWNTPIPQDAEVHPDSNALIDHLANSSEWPGLGINIHPWSIPVYWVDDSVPLVDVSTPLSNQGEDVTLQIPIPEDAEPDPESDGHMCIVNRGTGQSWDFYQGRDQGSSWECTLCSTVDLNGTGVRPPKDDNQPWYESHGSRACGFPLIAGLITVEEMRAGRIDHALVLAYPGIRSRYYTPPASTAQGTFGTLSQDWGIPCGGRVQLDPSLDIDSLGLTPSGVVIARALQEYGAFIGDYSGSINLYADGSADARTVWDGGLLENYEVTDEVDLLSLRVLTWGQLYDDNN